MKNQRSFVNVKSKKIVFVSNTSWYLSNFRTETIDYFLDSGFEVHAVCGDDDLLGNFVNRGLIFHNLFIKLNSKNPFFEFITFLNLFTILFKLRPDFCFSFTSKINLYTGLIYLKNCILVTNVSGLGRGYFVTGYLGKFLRHLFHVAFNRADFVVLQNLEDYKFCTNTLLLPPTKLSLTAGSGVDITRFNANRVYTEKKIKFGFFSRLIEEKGILLLLEACEALAGSFDFDIVVAGPYGLDSQMPQNVFAERLDRIGGVYLGELKDVVSEMSSCDYVVLPSFYPEGTPKVLLEACALGCVIVTSDTPGCREVAGTERGFIVAPNSLHSLLEALTHCLELDLDDRIRLSLKSIDHASRCFDVQDNVEIYTRIVSTLTAD